MSKPFIQSINYMRGLCMLGVIGIHVGSVTLAGNHPNTALVAVMEIISRFSVPTFFFLSAFGMFYSHPLSKAFSYGSYLRRRIKTVLIPYLFWSAFYLLYSSIITHNYSSFEPAALARTLVYGLSMYHIYFLVILLWFYFLMPLWRALLRLMNGHAVFSFTLLFALNVLFNFYSSYIWDFHSSSQFLQDAFDYRLNYIVLHYLFIFMFGAYTAEHFEDLKAWIARHGIFINLFQLVSVLGMLAAYYGIMHFMQYDPLSAVNTVHQLSPTGMVYTLSTIVFLLYWWECRSVPQKIHRVFKMLGDYSYPIYLVHPLFLSILTGLTVHFNLYLRAIHIVLMYCIVVALAAGFSALLPKLHLPDWMYICLKGK